MHEPCRGPEDRLIRAVATSLKARHAMHRGDSDEAIRLFWAAAEMRDEDDESRYLELMAIVRIHFEQGRYAQGFQVTGQWARKAMRIPELFEGVPYDMLILARFGDLSISPTVPEFLEALADYESRFLADKNLGLAELWRHDPEKGLDLLLRHSPHPPSPGPPGTDNGLSDSRAE